MSSQGEEARLPGDLVAAFTEMGPAWGRWVQACLPDDTASYARLRVLTALECDGDRTMKQLAEALQVTPRRVTVLVDALEEHGLVERYAHQSGSHIAEAMDKLDDRYRPKKRLARAS